MPPFDQRIFCFIILAVSPFRLEKLKPIGVTDEKYAEVIAYQFVSRRSQGAWSLRVGGITYRLLARTA